MTNSVIRSTGYIKEISYIIRLLVIAASFMLLGCTSHPSYPATWSQLQQTASCPNIEGIYFDKGEGATDHIITGYQPSLSSIIMGDNINNEDGKQYITLTQEHERLIFTSYSEDKILSQRTSNYNPENCQNGFISIEDPKPEGGVNRDGVIGYSWSKYQLSKTSGGELIIRSDSGGVAVVLLIPAAGSQWVWYRFPKKQKTTP